MANLFEILRGVVVLAEGIQVGAAAGKVLSMEESQARNAVHAIVTNGSVELIDQFDAAFLQGASMQFNPAATRRALRLYALFKFLETTRFGQWRGFPPD